MRVQFSDLRVGNDEILGRVEQFVTRVERRPLPGPGKPHPDRHGP